MGILCKGAPKRACLEAPHLPAAAIIFLSRRAFITYSASQVWIRGHSISHLDICRDVIAKFDNCSSSIASRYVRHWDFDWFAPYPPEVIIIVRCRFNFYQNLIGLWLWSIDVLYSDNLLRIFVMFPIDRCFHLYTAISSIKLLIYPS